MFEQNGQHQNVREWGLQQKHNSAFQPQEEKRKEEAEPSLEQDFANNTTLHGLNRLADPKKPIWLRIAWLLAVLACGGVCVWQISLRVSDYIAYDANTKISVLYRPKLNFPAVTICNFNRFRASEITATDGQFLQYVLLADDYDYASYDNSESEFSWYGTSFDYYTAFENASASFNYTEFTRRAGFVLDETTLIECTWRGRKCSAQNFTHVFTSFGNCYTFNKGENDDGDDVTILQEDQPGVGNGLHLMLNIQQEEYTETFAGNREAGLKILVHDQIDPPLMDSLGSAIPPGFHAFVGVRRNEYHNLGYPWGECDKSASLAYYDSYTLSGCFIECRLEHIVRECQCRPVRYPGTAEVCTPYESVNCVSDVLRRFKNGEFGSCDCPVACSYTQFESSISYGLLPSYSVADDLYERYQLNSSYLEANIVTLDVYYEELNFQKVEQNIAVTTSSLISDIGGNLGLFLGGSILTLGELFEYIANRFRRCYSRKQPAAQQDSMTLGPRVIVNRDATTSSNSVEPR